MVGIADGSVSCDQPADWIAGDMITSYLLRSVVCGTRARTLTQAIAGLDGALSCQEPASEQRGRTASVVSSYLLGLAAPREFPTDDAFEEGLRDFEFAKRAAEDISSLMLKKNLHHAPTIEVEIEKAPSCRGK